MMEGGDTGGYSHGVLKSMMNDECHSLFCFVFVPRRSLLSVGASFPYVGSRFRTWAVIFVHGRLSRGGGGGGWGGLMCRRWSFVFRKDDNERQCHLSSSCQLAT